MKRSTIAALAALALLGAAFASSAWAQFEAPLPVGSDPTQVNGGPATKTDAHFLKFFNHPWPGQVANGVNFDDPKGAITVKGRNYVIRDLAATPGLKPDDPTLQRAADRTSEMIDSLGSRAPTQQVVPIQGFCPEGYFAKDPKTGAEVYVVFDCNLLEDRNFKSRQLEIADIRNELKGTPKEFEGLIMQGIDDPLLSPLGLIASAQESLPPYSAELYPATAWAPMVANQNIGFLWQVFNQPPEESFNEVIAYDLADLTLIDNGNYINRGLVSASYDPVNLDLLAEFVLGYKDGMTSLLLGLGDPRIAQALNGLFSLFVGSCQPAPGGGAQICPNADMPFLSPLAFFRADHDVGRMRLGGYSSILQIPKSGLPEIKPQPGKPIPLDKAQDLLASLLGQSFNPIAVVEMEYPGGSGAAMLPRDPNNPPAQPVEPPEPVTVPSTHGFAVVNQAPALTFDQLLILNGKPVLDKKTLKALKWSDIFKYRDDQGNLADILPPVLPHKSLSTAVFWERGVDHLTKKPVVWGPGNHSQDTLNPNYVYDPFVLSLIGPGAFGATEMTDMINGAKVPTLVVPSSVLAVDDAYVYKINPQSLRRVYLKLAEIEGPLPIVIPDAYRVETPPGGFSPYQAAATDVIDAQGNRGSDGCSDLILTFRGVGVTRLDAGMPAFKNSYDQHVAFQTTDGTKRAFSNEVWVYPGILNNTQCDISSTPKLKFVLPKDAQVSAINVADFSHNGGGNDLLVGDLMPREILSGPDGGQFAAHAFLFKDFFPLDMKQIRVGFSKTNQPQGDPAEYLFAAMKGEAGKLAGVSALTRDRQGDVVHIGGISGTPLMLPPFGCPADDNLQVSSAPELLLAMAADIRNMPGNVNHELKAQRCFDPQVCKVTLRWGGGEVNLPFLVGDPCCDPCSDWGDPNIPGRCRGTLCDQARPEYKPLCDHYTAICLHRGASNAIPEKASSQPLAQREDDAGVDTGLAPAWRPDIVVGADGHGIISAKALVPAGALVCVVDGDKKTWEDCDPKANPTGCGNNQVCLDNCKCCGDGKFHPPNEQCDPQEGVQRCPQKQYCNKQCQCAAPPVQKDSDKFDIYKPPPAQPAEPPPPLDPDRPPPVPIPPASTPPPRLSRGHVMPGPRELTVVFNVAEQQEWKCEPHGPVGGPVECNLDHACPNQGKGEICTMECKCHASCSDTGGPLAPGWQCNRDTTCIPGNICTVEAGTGNCVCKKAEEPIPVPPGAGPASPGALPIANDCTCRVLSDPSTELRDYRQNLNRDYIALPANRPDYEALVFHEHRVQCVCQAEDSTAADGSILPYRTLQLGGGLFVDFAADPGAYQWKKVNGAKPLQLLPFAGEQAKAEALNVDLDASVAAAGGVLWSSYEISPNVSRGAGNAVDINNVFHFDAFPAAGGAGFTISSGFGDFNLASKADGTYFTYTFQVGPACPSFTQVEGYREGCIEKGGELKENLEGVKGEITKRVGSGNGSTVFVGLPWEPIYNYQLRHLQAITAGKVQAHGGKPIQDLQFGILAGNYLAARGGGCGCSIPGTPFEAGSVVPLILLGAGLAVARMRARRK